MADIVKRLENPPFGTETSERNLMQAAADEIKRLRERATTICAEVEARRAEQIAKGYDAAHDDEHKQGEIAVAAAAYAMAGAHKAPAGAMLWPWEISQFRPDNARNNLIDAAALCVAEIERIDRAAR